MNDEAKFEKITSYLQLADADSQLLAQVIGLYMNQFGEQEYDVDRDNIEYQPEERSNVSEALDEALAWSRKEPASPVDAATQAIEAPLRKLDAILQQADDYYLSQGYLKDSFVRGQALHEAIIAAYEELMPIQGEFMALIGGVEREQQQEMIQTLESRGAFIAATLMKIISASSDFDLHSGCWQIVEESETVKFNPDEVRPLISRLGGLLGELAEMIRDENQVSKECLSVELLNRFMEQAGLVKTTLAALADGTQSPSGTASLDDIFQIVDIIFDLFNDYTNIVDEAD